SMLHLRMFFHHTPPTTPTSTLALHDALPILWAERCSCFRLARFTTSWRRSASWRFWAPSWCWVPFLCCSTPDRAWEPTSLAAQKDRKSTRLNSSHVKISYAVFCLKKKNSEHT